MTSQVQPEAAQAASLAHDVLSRIVSRPLFWVVFVTVAMAVPMVRAILTPLPPPLPVLSQVPRFQLTDQHGNPYGSDQLEGKIWVANFIFTRCPTVCPALTSAMGKVQHRGRNLGEAW